MKGGKGDAVAAFKPCGGVGLQRLVIEPGAVGAALVFKVIGRIPEFNGGMEAGNSGLGDGDVVALIPADGGVCFADFNPLLFLAGHMIQIFEIGFGLLASFPFFLIGFSLGSILLKIQKDDPGGHRGGEQRQDQIEKVDAGFSFSIIPFFGFGRYRSRSGLFLRLGDGGQRLRCLGRQRFWLRRFKIG